MRTSRAAIAGIGVTGSLVAAAFCVFLLASAAIVFDGWPGAGVSSRLRELVVHDAARTTAAAKAAHAPARPVAPPPATPTTAERRPVARRPAHRAPVLRAGTPHTVAGSVRPSFAGDVNADAVRTRERDGGSQPHTQQTTKAVAPQTTPHAPRHAAPAPAPAPAVTPPPATAPAGDGAARRGSTGTDGDAPPVPKTPLGNAVRNTTQATGGTVTQASHTVGDTVGDSVSGPVGELVDKVGDAVGKAVGRLGDAIGGLLDRLGRMYHRSSSPQGHSSSGEHHFGADEDQQ